VTSEPKEQVSGAKTMEGGRRQEVSTRKATIDRQERVEAKAGNSSF
jgi:hypothetical protein